jgi:trehalose 6-phosphate phosphatase
MSEYLYDHIEDLRPGLDSERPILILSDFDGTLAPLASRPEEAHLPEGVRETLLALAEHPRCVVGILSGRGLEDVRVKVGLDPLVYSGNHGLEIRGPEVEFVEPAALAAVPVLREMVGRLRDELVDVPGSLVEDKHLSVSVHTRLVPELLRKRVHDAVEAAVATSRGLYRIFPGHAVYEIRPQGPWNKGTAAIWIKERLAPEADLVVMMGDDRTDEDAFAALPDSVTVKVGLADGRPTLARYHVESPAEVAALLRWMGDGLGLGLGVAAGTEG